MKYVNYGVLGSTSGFPQISLNDIHTVQQGVFESNKAMYKKCGGDGTNPVIIGVAVTETSTTFDSTAGYILTPDGYSIPIASNTGAAKVGGGQYYIKVNTPTGYGPPAPQAGGGAIQRHFQISAAIEHLSFSVVPTGYYNVSDCGGQSIMVYDLSLNAQFGYSGAGYSRYQRSVDGIVTVEFKGVQQTSAGVNLTTLPVGYRPKNKMEWHLVSTLIVSPFSIDVDSSGAMTIKTIPVSGVFTSIISYPTL